MDMGIGLFLCGGLGWVPRQEYRCVHILRVYIGGFWPDTQRSGLVDMEGPRGG